MIDQKQRKILLMGIGGILLALISIGILFLLKSEENQEEIQNNTNQIEEGLKEKEEKLPKDQISIDNSKDEDENPPTPKKEE